MGISSSVGLVSGLETDSIITSLMNLERAPITQLQQKQAVFQSKISSYGMVKSALSKLQSSISALKNTDNFAPGFTATSSNKDILGVSVSDTDTVSAGTYKITVNNLATAAQMTGNTYTESDSTVGAGVLHFQVGNGEKHSVAVDSDQTLEGLAAAINGADMDVSASVIRVAENDYRMSITANDTGQDISYTFQQEGLTFETTSQAGDSSGEVMTSQSFASDSTALGLNGVLSVNGNDLTLNGTQSLNDIQAFVDGISGISAQVNFDSESGTYSLEVENETAGDSLEINFSDGTGLSNLMDAASYLAAEKAEVVINNITVERDSNTIDDLVSGVTLTLSEEDSTTPLTVSVAENYNTASEKVNAFVEAYNSTISTLQNLQSYSSDTGTGGNLLGDSTAKLLTSGLRRMVFSSIDGMSLSNLGVEMEESGELSYDSSVFATAMKNNADDVTEFFTSESAGSNGFAVAFDSYLDGYVDSTDGILQAKIDGYNKSSSRIDDTIESIEFRLEKREETMRKQYESLELLLSSYSSTASYLTSQLDGLSNLSKSIYG